MRLKQFTDELFLVSDMETLTSAYEEISVMKMQQIRHQVISTRSFIEGVTDVFRDVKSSYKHQLEQLMKKNKKDQNTPLTLSTIPNNGKDVIVLLSANGKLYGDIIVRTFDAFFDEIKMSPNADIVIIGKLGREIFNEKKLQKKYTYFEVPDIKITLDDLKPLVAFIANYQTVKVYYGKFENVVTQNPDMSIVSGQKPLSEEVAEEQSGKALKFFFEPSLKNILHFFETQLFSSIFKQTLSEHELARYASRIKAMEEATTNIHNKKRSLNRSLKRERNSIENAKQLSAFSGISLWQRSH